MPTPPPPTIWLSRFAALTALATLGLIGVGGLVTSHGAGMAVPDWPTTYGYNMFLFPVSQWVGGVFYEHTHRLYASAVGFLTVILALWLQFRWPDRRVRVWGWVALGLVIVQGLLGGLRVALMKDELGVLHAALAQAFFLLLVLLALVTSPRWSRWRAEVRPLPPGLHRWLGVVTGLLFVQLVVGAAMRHQHAGLAVPDFPLAYGRVWPPTDDAFLQQVNAQRSDTRDFHPVSAFHIHLHMAHRILAAIAGITVGIAAIRLRRTFGPGSLAGRVGTIWGVAILGQVLLGAATVWSNKAADVATAHVALGAACLALGAVSVALCRTGRSVAECRAVPVARRTGIEAPGAATPNAGWV